MASQQKKMWLSKPIRASATILGDTIAQCNGIEQTTKTTTEIQAGLCLISKSKQEQGMDKIDQGCNGISSLPT